MKRIFLTLCAFIVCAQPVAAQERGTRDQAVAIANKVQAYYRKHGSEETFEAITQRTNPDFLSKIYTHSFIIWMVLMWRMALSPISLARIYRS